MFSSFIARIAPLILTLVSGVNAEREPSIVSEGAPQVLHRSPVATLPLVRRFPKVGRNEPCPCGSNKKFKNCHEA